MIVASLLFGALLGIRGTIWSLVSVLLVGATLSPLLGFVGDAPSLSAVVSACLLAQLGFVVGAVVAPAFRDPAGLLARLLPVRAGRSAAHG